MVAGDCCSKHAARPLPMHVHSQLTRYRVKPNRCLCACVYPSPTNWRNLSDSARASRSTGPRPHVFAMEGRAVRARVSHGELVSRLAAITNISDRALAIAMKTLKDSGIEINRIQRKTLSDAVLKRCPLQVLSHSTCCMGSSVKRLDRFQP